MIIGQDAGINQRVADIFGLPESAQLNNFIKEYQQVNQKLYQY
jgi:hypothetical protein